MGIFQGDLIIKTAIELGMEDMRKNPWLIDHMLGDVVSNQYLRDKYGQKQIEMKHMGDLSTETTVLMPNTIGKPIPYIVKPFTPKSYDHNTGEVGIDPNTKG